MIKVNLLSPEKKEVAAGGEPAAFLAEEEKVSKIHTGAVLGAVLFTLGVIGFLYFTQSNTLNSKKRELEEKQARKAELDEVLKTITKLENTKKRLDKKVRIITELKGKQANAVRVMDEVSKALPEMVWLTKLNFGKNVLKLEGTALSNDLIADFIDNLRASNYFQNEQFQGSNRKKQGGIDVFNFKLSFSFNPKVGDTKKKVI